MKKLLQFVALALTLSVSAQPLFAERACAQQACGNRPTMACCDPSIDAMPSMDMSCGQPAVTGPMRCTNTSCCILSAGTAPAPALASSDLSSPTLSSVSLLPAGCYKLPVLSATRRPPGPGLLLPTARYILFRDFRI